MVRVDARDRVVRLQDVPPCDAGSPRPVVLATEHELLVGYFLRTSIEDEEAIEAAKQPVAIVRFRRPVASTFGPPNDEAIQGHPLAARGLEPYDAFEVLDSSWVRELERRNSVHPHHDPRRYDRLRHFVLTFHDSTFECVAEGYASVQGVGALESLLFREAAKGPR
ncbi:MAG: hypothetical protein JNM84_28050 [Planctomycetes bacterium]|nr:hypothetical protein [Planctomycetota bacterium]